MKEHDCLRRFLFEEYGIRGEWVKLVDSWQQAKRHQTAAPVVEQQLGQALAAVVLLSATIKFNGSIILQAQGNGHFRTLVAQSTHGRKIRGWVRSIEPVRSGSLEDMFGQGRLVITIEPDNSEPYQGIVPLRGNNLAAALRTYFEQSEQLSTRLWLVADESGAAGLLLQELPAQPSGKPDRERLELLADTLTEKELLELDCEPLLHRLFHQEKVRLFDAEPVEFGCSCSREKLEATLRTFSRAELEEILREKGTVEAGCHFCNAVYRFDRTDIDIIVPPEDPLSASATRH
ncbi:Hsp33 family molecular chaperone HslO [Methylosarcina fibrata]|uniref:Hsp33 family molecular chaperone HslO n=1 Tax=Methylosarcina fibrata TaxID=105972 RepID=UPI00036D407F|nr:Hsp33 family molecular chaperone HslO [Methylosarcina fibrata]